MGVWIEIQHIVKWSFSYIVTPLVGVWIEMRGALGTDDQRCVTPLVGVWIEINMYLPPVTVLLSLPLWECGLK